MDCNKKEQILPPTEIIVSDKEKAFQEWCKQIVHLQQKIILPDGSKFDKKIWVTPNGFDTGSFTKFLYEYFKEIK